VPYKSWTMASPVALLYVENFLSRNAAFLLSSHLPVSSLTLCVCYCLQEYYTTAALCVVLIFLWPIGLPTAVFLSLHKYRKLILEKDPDTLHMFGNLIMDYKPQYYWWEVVEFVRKLILMVNAHAIIHPSVHRMQPI
jgi:hypothetical protein